MTGFGEAYVAFDVSKERHTVAIAEAGRGGEVRVVGTIPNTGEAVFKLVRRLAAKYATLHFCYEAGPTGYGLFRQLTEMGHDTIVVAPSLIPRRPGARVKTDRRDAVNLVKLLRAGELTAVWVPDAVHEGVRDLVRAREAAVEDLRRQRQRVGGFLLRHGRIYACKTSWSGRHLRWLHSQKFDHPAHQFVLQEGLKAIQDAQDRIDRLTGGLRESLDSWSMAPVVAAYQAMRGVAFITAVTFVAEIGDVRRFDSPRELMAYLGLVPSERSSGATVKRGGITRTGNPRARRVLVEGAWTYRHPARIGISHSARLKGLPKAVRDIAWKAQARLCRRYRRLAGKGKKVTVVTTAIAREMAAFLWAIAHHVEPDMPKTSC